MVKNKEGEEVVQRSMWVNKTLWNKTKAQAAENDKTISDVIRILLEKWTSGEITIDDDKK